MLTEVTRRMAPMAAEPDSGTKTVRVAASAATKLQTISALKEQMGQRFRPVEFLNGLIEGPIDELYEKVVKEFADHQSGRKPGRK